MKNYLSPLADYGRELMLNHCNSGEKGVGFELYSNVVVGELIVKTLVEYFE